MIDNLLLGINIGGTVTSVILMVIMISSLLINDDMSKAANRIFLGVCIMMIVILVADILTDNLAVFSSNQIVFKIVLSIAYVSVNVYVTVFTFYMSSVLREKAFIDTSVGYPIIFIVGVFSSLWVIDIFCNLGMFVRITGACEFAKTSVYWLVIVPPLLIVLFDAALAFSFRKLLHTRDIVPWFVYAFSPVLGLLFYPFLGAAPLYVAEALALLFVFAFEHNQRQRRVALAEKELADSKMKLMVSQIQPHFMYNSLNTIYYLIAIDPDEAQEAVSTFSDYLRQNINALKSDKPVKFSEELGHTEAYLYLEKMRFGDKLNIIIEEGPRNFVIPPLSLQPLVENAIKHGISQKEDQSGSVTISTREDHNYYYVEVIDDGVGFKAGQFDDSVNTHTHIGIFNVYSRIESMCGGSLSVSSAPGKGTHALIRLPKEQQSTLEKEAKK